MRNPRHSCSRSNRTRMPLTSIMTVVRTLQHHAKASRDALLSQEILIDAADKTLTQAYDDVRALNVRLKKVTDKVAPTNMIVNVICWFLLMTVIGYISFETPLSVSLYHDDQKRFTDCNLRMFNLFFICKSIKIN